MARDLVVSLLLFLAVVLGGLYLASYVGQLTSRDAGYVLISAHGYTVQTSVFFLAVITAAFALVSYVAISLFVWLWSLLFERKARRQRRAQRQILEGLQRLSTGQWQRAEPLLAKGAQAGVFPGLSYAGAALAAEKRGETETAKRYWLEAGQLSGEPALVAAMARAELALERHQIPLARDLLQPFGGAVRDYPRLQSLLARVLAALGDWDNLEKLLTLVRDHQTLDPVELRQWQRQLYSARFSQAGTNVEQLQLRWNRLDRGLQDDEPLLLAFVAQLHDAGETTEAESRLRLALNHQWSDRLIQAYGQLTRVNPQSRLAVAEAWLSTQSENPVLLRVLGQLATATQQSDKARAYLEQALKLQPDADTYRQLAELLEGLGDGDGALACYRNGLQQLSGQTSTRPKAATTPALTSS